MPAGTSKKYLLLMLPLALLLVGGGCTRELKYVTFEDCLLENIGGSETEAAALVIAQACKAKFPPSEEEMAVEQAAIAEMAAAAERAAKEAEAAMAPLIKEQQTADAAYQTAMDVLDAAAADADAAAVPSGSSGG